MDNKIFANISKIIERDSKTATYKLALLRGVIDLIQDNSPFIKIKMERVYFPLGLLIEKWVLYYYPILDTDLKIPQISLNRQLAFEEQFKKIISAYKDKGGLSVFYNDLKANGIPKALHDDFSSLVKKIHNTITKMPMRHIGYSLSKAQYSIFKYSKPKDRLINTKEIDTEYLVNNFGWFSIPIEYYEVLKFIGSFINGKDSIIFKWAEFSINASKNSLSMNQVLTEILTDPITNRDITESKNLYNSILKSGGNIFCVWTGRLLKRYDVDHVIPFSIWKNNDLWNLLPSDSTINNHKRNKIPSVELIASKRQMILYYWEMINKYQNLRFQKELKISLIGQQNINNWQEVGLNQLQRNCEYLITIRGFEEWNI